MKLLVIGGVAAGTKAAAKFLREDRASEALVLTMSEDVSYAGCGLPYYVGGMIETRGELIVNTPEHYAALTGAKVLTSREAVALDAAAHKVTAKNLKTGETETYEYDRCVIATGASPVCPDLPGVGLDGVFTVRTPDDAEEIRRYIENTGARRAVVVGGGFIGLEMAENLADKGLSVTVAEAAEQILGGVLDFEMADFLRRKIEQSGVRVLTSAALTAVEGETSAVGVQTAAGRLSADVVILSIGVRPNTAFLAESGIDMQRGAILVDERMATNLPDVFAAGDCALVKNRITGARQYSPMGSTANLSAREMARGIAGGSASYPGVLGTGVAKVPGLSAARTGLTEKQARDAGFDVITALAVTDDKAHYYADAAWFATKLVADKSTHKLLGAQVIGPGAVDKMADIAAVGLSMGAKLEDFDNLDLAYAPPFSTAIHPFVQAVYILENKLSGEMVSMTPAEYLSGAAKGMKIIDAAPAPAIPGATHVSLENFGGTVAGVEKDEPCLIVCVKGKRAYFLQNRMRAAGYTNTRVLEGSTFFNTVRVENAAGCALPPDEVTRLKALGCLWDKRTPDCFNVRIITVNGKISAEQHMAIAEAAKRYGSGEVAMTSRLTLEIQRVKYENIEPLRAFVGEYGLITGGTGSKVRPVVSCKGTTCQYGLIDTFALSQRLHELFFIGYKDVKLPHKFKIAVGGCPNNCVKPSLNDVGVIGQKVPRIDLEKCRGCKVCSVEAACPIKIAKLSDGKLSVDVENECNHCGRCVGKCPFHVTDEFVTGYRLYLGGRWGKRVAEGKPLSKIFTDERELIETVEKTILFFREYGITGERLSDTIARVGFDEVERILMSDELMQNKAQNLAAEKHMKGGATC